eukprot:INCI16121.1.p1 GENE.INCI16121.1~~INCI16121.1.p1  ORF type:complete len:395 (-),score=64.84 INCI16121.1:215-1399(-)
MSPTNRKKNIRIGDSPSPTNRSSFAPKHGKLSSTQLEDSINRLYKPQKKAPPPEPKKLTRKATAEGLKRLTQPRSRSRISESPPPQQKQRRPVRRVPNPNRGRSSSATGGGIGSRSRSGLTRTGSAKSVNSTTPSSSTSPRSSTRTRNSSRLQGGTASSRARGTPTSPRVRQSVRGRSPRSAETTVAPPLPTGEGGGAHGVVAPSLPDEESVSVESSSLQRSPEVVDADEEVTEVAVDLSNMGVEADEPATSSSAADDHAGSTNVPDASNEDAPVGDDAAASSQGMPRTFSELGISLDIEPAVTEESTDSIDPADGAPVSHSAETENLGDLGIILDAHEDNDESDGSGGDELSGADVAEESVEPATGNNEESGDNGSSDGTSAAEAQDPELLSF